MYHDQGMASGLGQMVRTDHKHSAHAQQKAIKTLALDEVSNTIELPLLVKNIDSSPHFFFCNNRTESVISNSLGNHTCERTPICYSSHV